MQLSFVPAALSALLTSIPGDLLPPPLTATANPSNVVLTGGDCGGLRVELWAAWSLSVASIESDEGVDVSEVTNITFSAQSGLPVMAAIVELMGRGANAKGTVRVRVKYAGVYLTEREDKFERWAKDQRVSLSKREESIDEREVRGRRDDEESSERIIELLKRAAKLDEKAAIRSQRMVELEAEKAASLDELRRGLYCSQCGEPASRIARTEPFLAHVRRVYGVVEAASPARIAKEAAKYDSEIANERKARDDQLNEAVQARTQANEDDNARELRRLTLRRELEEQREILGRDRRELADDLATGRERFADAGAARTTVKIPFRTTCGD